MVSSTAKSIEEDTQRAAAEVQLQKYGKFIEDYTERLTKIEERLLPYTPTPSTLYVSIDFRPKENADANDIINCDNKIIDKILRAFAALCMEATYVKTEFKRKYLKSILYYGEELLDGNSGKTEEASYEDCQLAVSEMLPQLQNLSTFAKHCERVVLEIVSQLSAFYDLNIDVNNNVNLYEVFDALGEILIVLITIQEVLANNNTLIYHWSLYKRTIQLASHSASEFPYSVKKIDQLNQLIAQLENYLIAERIFDSVLALPYDRKISVTKNKKLSDQLNSYLRNTVSELERTVQHESVDSAAKWMKACLTFVLSLNLFGGYDKKIPKSLSAGLKRFALITLHGNVTFQMEEFVLKYAGHLLRTADRKLFDKDASTQQQYSITDVTAKLNRDVPFYALQVLSWVLKLEQAIKHRDASDLSVDYLREIHGLLFEGVRYASCIKTTLSTVCNLYVTTKKPMTRSSLLSFCRLIEILKSLEYAYYRHHSQLSGLINYVIQYAKYECVGILNNVNKQLTKDGNRTALVEERKIDILSSLVIAEDSLNCGPPTELRVLIAKLCLNLAAAETQQLSAALQKLSVTPLLQDKLQTLLECSFVYNNKEIVPIYLQEINSKERVINRTEYFLSALIDNGNDNANGNQIVRMFNNIQSECLNDVQRYVVHPLCERVEENIRLHVLRHLRKPNEITIAGENFELNNFFGIRTVHVGKKYRVDVKKLVEDYLNKTFYDLSTVALHNYQIHEQMKTLAAHKFQLQTVNDNLPNYGLEHGLDLLEITRNIHTFVANYFYNLNNQIFIEIRSNNKHLNTINIRHIANSIRSHGTGIMNTAVNHTYQFLCQKLNNFSQFLFDEQIKSRLLKEISLYKEQRQTDELNAKYSFERAERFNRAIQKLSGALNGTHYLDQFRSLITQIGNALGYIRMIKSGGLHCCSDAAQFIPNLKRIVNFEQLTRRDNLSELCCQTAANLDNTIENIANKITDGTNYFKLLVDVFAPVLREVKNNHLRNFYIIVPSLTINFVEYIIASKESMIKKNNITACFTDDGFVIGIAYLLQVLNLNSEFDSLHWFQAIRERNRLAVDKLSRSLSTASKEDVKLQHTLNLSFKNIDIYQKEYNLLYYNLSSARILFENRNEETNND